MVGFEPTCRLITDKTISSRSRYDHFDTSPYLVVFEFCTAFARPELKCIHPKFKKNEAFARYCEKTRAFEGCGVISSATFRVGAVMSCCGIRNFFARCSLLKISTAATPFCSLHPPPAAVANVPTPISLRI